MIRTLILTLALACTASGCASGPRPILRGGMFPSVYRPPVGHNTLKGDGFVVTVEKLQNGGMATNFYAEITVRNISQTAHAFDPGDVELTIPETGMTYQHLTKDKSTVTVPLGFNLMTATTIKPGHMITGYLWFQTPTYKAEAKQVQLSYRDRTLDLPPPVAQTSNHGTEDGAVD